MSSGAQVLSRLHNGVTLETEATRQRGQREQFGDKRKREQRKGQRGGREKVWKEGGGGEEKVMS